MKLYHAFYPKSLHKEEIDFIALIFIARQELQTKCRHNSDMQSNNIMQMSKFR